MTPSRVASPLNTDTAFVSHDAYLARRHFGSLDGLRALSILGVVWHHTAAVAHPASPLGYMGAQGVTLFFAISGFLITTLLLREADRHGSIDLKAFYVRRSLRIFPMYYAVLLLYVLLVWARERHTEEGREFFDNLPYFLTYTSNWFVELDGRVIFYFAWSLATEEQFYLLWPPLMVLLLQSQRYRPAAWVLALVSLAVGLLDWARAVPAVLAPLSEGFSKLPLAMIGGVCLALTLHQRAGFERWQALLASPWASALWLAAVLLALWWPTLPSPAVHLAMVGLVGACVVPASHVLSAVFNSRWMVHIGAVSYGLYLLHMLAKNVAALILGRVSESHSVYLEFGLTLAIGLLAATLSYRYFEAPLLRLKHRFER